jgi:predicted KAP-like P-loop ATPase
MTSRTDRQADDDGLNFIKDEASDRDFFGSHDRVAGAMAEVIRRDRGLRIVGLLGPWGSGKSTVVRLMEAALRPAEPEVRIFYYDAWLHQNDPPKRSFLERFVNFLADAELIEPADWH